MSLLIKLFFIFFKIGMFSFGGGYAMLSIIFEDIETLNIISKEEFSDLVALSNITPGPIAVNAATYVGYKCSGIWGSIFATIGVSLPSFILVIIISAFFNKFKTNRDVQAVLSGIKPATIGMIASAAVTLSQTSVFNFALLSFKTLLQPLKIVHIPSLIIFILTIIGAKKFKLGPILLTLLSAILGVVFYFIYQYTLHIIS